MITLADPAPDETRRATRWAAGVAASALVHLGGVWLLTQAPAPAAPSEPALMLELARLTQAPETPPTPEPAEQPAPPEPEAASERPPEPPTAAQQQAPQSTPPEEEPVRQEQPLPDPALPEPAPPEPVPPDPPNLVQAESSPVSAPPVPVPPPRPAVPPRPKPPAPRPVRPIEPPPDTAATRAPAPAAPSPPVAQVSSQALADWRSRLLAHLNRFKRYPAAALMRRTQGVAYVHLLLMPDGTARDVRLATSSGAPMLDEEALALIGRATPMPARPDSGPTELVVPVQFAVR